MRSAQELVIVLARPVEIVEISIDVSIGSHNLDYQRFGCRKDAEQIIVELLDKDGVEEIMLVMDGNIKRFKR